MSAKSMAQFWLAAQVTEPRLTQAELRQWFPDLVEVLRDIGILTAIRTVNHAVCTECPDGHVERVVRLEYPTGVRFSIACPEHGRVDIAEKDLVESALNFDALANWLAHSLGATEPETVFQGHLWRLGRVALGGKARDAWCLRAYQAAPVQIETVMPKTSGSVLFVYGTPAGVVIPALRADHVIHLADLASLDHGQLRLDVDALSSRLIDIVAPAKPSKCPKRGKRTALIESIKAYMREHIRSAKEYYRDLEDQGEEVTLFPPPTQKMIAQALKVTEVDISRAINDGDRELDYLKKVVESIDLTIQFGG